MEWITTAFDWASSHNALFWWLFATSSAFFLLTPIAVTWAVVRLPSDYFTQKTRRPLGSWSERPMLRMALVVLKNILGLLLLVAGILMLMLPGQGLLTILVGLMLVDFPGKFRFERWLVTQQQVWRSINWLRKRARKPALLRPS